MIYVVKLGYHMEERRSLMKNILKLYMVKVYNDFKIWCALNKIKFDSFFKMFSLYQHVF